MDDTVPHNSQYRQRLSNGIPTILLLGSWLVLFQGADLGGGLVIFSCLALLGVIHFDGGMAAFSFLTALLTAALMALQPDTQVAVSQTGIACAWLLTGFLWANRSSKQFRVYLLVILGGVFLLFIGFQVLLALSFFEGVRVSGAKITLAAAALFMGFPLAFMLGQNKHTLLHLRQGFLWPASFVLVGLCAYASIGLATSFNMAQSASTTVSEKQNRAQRLASQLSHAWGYNEIRNEKDRALLAGDWAKASELMADGFWRRWSGMNKHNLNVDDILVLWTGHRRARNVFLTRLCQQEGFVGSLASAGIAIPFWLQGETHWACIAKHSQAWSDDLLLDAMAEEMVFGEAQKAGVRLGGCRLSLASTFPATVSPGETFAYEMHLAPWLHNGAGLKLCPDAGKVELYIWGSKAKDVIPFAWFSNEEGLAFRQWQLPEYMRVGRYPVIANIRTAPKWRTGQPHGIHSGRRGLFLGWVDVVNAETN